MATHFPSPAVQYTKLNATTSSNDPRLIVLSVHVEGASRPLRALLYSFATNNFVRADSLSILPSRLRVRESPGEMIVNYEDGVPRTHRQRSVVLPYRFDAFTSSDEFQVIDLSGSFDCIFGMPWLTRHRPDIDWLNRTVQPRNINVNVVLAVLNASTSTWQNVAVVNPGSTTHTREVCDGPSSVVCNSTTCSSSVERWFRSQESNPQQWRRVSHGRAVAPASVRSSKTARKQRLSVRHVRAVAPARVQDAAPAPKQRLSARGNTSKTASKQGLSTRHERAVAPVPVHVADNKPRQRSPATYAEAEASAGPVIPGSMILRRDDAQGSVRKTSPSCRRVLLRRHHLWTPSTLLA